MIKFNYRDSDMGVLPGEITCICGAYGGAMAKKKDELRKCNDHLRKMLRRL